MTGTTADTCAQTTKDGTATAARRTRPGASLITALLVTLLALAGCGGDAGSEDSSSEGSGTSEKSSQTSVADAEPLTSADFGERILAAQKKAGSFTFTLTQAAASAKVSGKGKASYGGDTADVQVATSTPGGDVESVVVDGVTYLKFPNASTDKPWVKLDPNGSGPIASMMKQMGGNQDPTAIARIFGKNATVKAGAQEKVGDVEARRYQVSIASADFAKATNVDAQLAGMLPKTIVYDVWVGGEDRVLKMVNELTVMGNESTTTIEFADYGSDVEISAPPADQTTTKEPSPADMTGGMG